MVNCSNYFDPNKTVALRTGGQRKNDLRLFATFQANFRIICPFPLYKNISVLDKLRQLVSCLKVSWKLTLQVA